MSDVFRYYSSGSGGGGNFDGNLPRHEVAIGVIKDIANCSSLLDIGCARGAFLSSIREIKPKCRVEGVELNPEYVKDAEQKKITVRSFDVTSEWPYHNHEFDVIHISAVLEHLFDYKTFFSEASRCVANGGLLIVSGPNVACLKCRLELLFGIVPCWYRNYEHIRMWTKSYLKIVASEYGFKLDKFAGVHARKTVSRSLLERFTPTLCAEFVAILRKVQ